MIYAIALGRVSSPLGLMVWLDPYVYNLTAIRAHVARPARCFFPS
jgi:hypothetical protein